MHLAHEVRTADTGPDLIDVLSADAAKQNRGGKPKSKLSTAEARREYQRRYYQLHKEKAKEYQRQYNLTHKKKRGGGRGRKTKECDREVIRTTFNTSDIQDSPMGKTWKLVELIVKRKRMFTM